MRITMKGSLLNPAMSRLQEAIRSGRIYQTKHLLESGVEVNFTDEEGLSPLMRAAQIADEKHRTRLSLLKLLLQYGANVNTVDTQGRHVLSWACIHEKEDVVRLLCSATIQDIDLNLTDLDGNTPLMHAARAGNTSIVKLLLDELIKFQVDIDIRNNEDRTPYLEAKRLGNNECAEILLKEGKASTNVQVNPFLDFLNEKDDIEWKGRIRSATESKLAVKSPKQKECLNQQRKSNKRARHSSLKKPDIGPGKRGEAKEPTLALRKNSNVYNAKERQRNNKIPVRMRKHAWTEIDTTRLETSRNFDIVAESITAADKSRQVNEGKINFSPKLTSMHDEVKTNSKYVGTLADDRLQRGFSQAREREIKKITAKLNHSFASDSSEGGTRFSRLRSRSVSSLTSEVLTDDDYSWYSHFSVYSSPSVAFLTKLMNVYGEQASSSSSFRSSVNSLKEAPKSSSPLPPKIFVAETMGDDRSDDGRSSVGSTRLSSGGGSRPVSSGRKFSEATRTVVSLLTTKKALAALKA